MKFVHIFVAALALAVGTAHAASRSDVLDTMTEADTHELENLAIRITAGATIPGSEARLALNGVLAALDKPAAGAADEKPHGWRIGYADARAGVYHDHRPAGAKLDQDAFYRGYEDGWKAGSAAAGY